MWVLKSLRAFQNPFFTSGVVTGSSRAAVSVLALSVIAARCHLSQRERPWHGGKVSGLSAK
ncbi:hypothetical protein C4N24_12250 [Faecalibacterium prausnitzii]|uniref:Uncharacterized protein n=1 Tax=Faecalibacterium prausnitzii TaxID=853 RepID=A0A329U438_9FIRM|nr:hypothetical protein C4N24_12250 [Faecalibacterium prausnitzii]